MKKYYSMMIAGLFCIALSSLSLASTAPPDNQCVIHLDKPFYISGDVIWYKLYLPQVLDKQDIAVKGLLIAASGKVEDRFFHKSLGNTYLDGHIKIPYSLGSGIYHLVFKAAPKDQQKELILAEIEIPIYNDLQEIRNAKDIEGATVAGKLSEVAGDLSVRIGLDREEYSVRDLITASVSIRDAGNKLVKSNISVSVIHYPADVIADYQTIGVGQSLSEASLQSLQGKIYVKGQLMDTLNNPIKANVLGAYASKQNKIHYAKTNEEGFFTLDLPDFYAHQTLQFMGYYKEEPEIRIKMDNDNEHGPTNKSLVINESIKEYLELSRQRKKLSQYYESLKPQYSTEEFVDEIQQLKPDFTYLTKEYVKFEDVGSFFNELITPLQLKKVKGKYVATMSNPTARITVQAKLKGSPLFIVDGKATRDANFAGNINLGNVESIDLFYIPENLRRQFNVMGSSGVVRITTVNPIFEIPRNDQEDLFEVSGLQPITDFVPYVPKTSSAEIKRPNFQSTLFWSPDQKTKADGTTDIQFHHTDDRGVFLIEVMAQGENGQIGIATKKYIVE